MRMAIGAVIGGVIGLGIWYLGKCTSGSCPLTNTPVITILAGALIGLLLAANKK